MRKDFVKKLILYISLSLLCFSIGIGLFLVRRNWMLIYWVPTYARSDDISGILNKKIALKKNINLFFYKDNSLKKEETSFVWLSSKAEILKLIIGNWLTLVYEERILEKRIRVESVALSSSEQEAYISFDQSLFLQEWPIHKKAQVLDGLCKTVDEAGLNIQNIMFLVDHEPLEDDHLDFSQPFSCNKKMFV